MLAGVLVLVVPAEDKAENQANEGPAVKQLEANGHGKVEDEGLKPEAKGWVVLEKQSGNQTHGWAHDATDADGNGKGNELGTVRWLHEGERQLSGQFSYNKEFQDKGNWPHDGKLFYGSQKSGTGDFSCVLRNVVDDHTKYHKAAHHDGENNVFKFVFGHKKSAFLWDSKLHMCCLLSSAGRKYRFQCLPYLVQHLVFRSVS